MSEELPKESFNEDFCLYLEYHLGTSFEKSGIHVIKHFWCDGVAMPFIDSQLTKKSVNDTRKIETMAWIGWNGQSEYQMTIHFGKYSLRRYARGTSLLDCIPSSDSMDWVDIDIEKHTIELWLK